MAVVLTSACGPTVDLTTGLQIDGLTTGWRSANDIDACCKLVPSVSFTLKNISDRQLPVLQVNAVFRRVSQDEEWDNRFRAVSGSAGLAPGAVTGRLTLEAELGYTGTDPYDALLRNSHFVDAKVDLFAKYGSAQWTRLGEFPIARQLLPTWRDDLVRADAGSVIEDLRGDHELVHAGLRDEGREAAAHGVR
jgi:hypothetical protein